MADTKTERMTMDLRPSVKSKIGRDNAERRARRDEREHIMRRLQDLADAEIPPQCAEVMGCLCACHAAGLSAIEPCDTDEARARTIAEECAVA